MLEFRLAADPSDNQSDAVDLTVFVTVFVPDERTMRPRKNMNANSRSVPPGKVAPR